MTFTIPKNGLIFPFALTFFSMSFKFRYFFLLSLLIIACKSDKKEPESPLFFQTASVIERSGENCDLPENECASISLFYPTATGGSENISEKINEHIRNHVIELVSSEENSQVSSLEELSAQFISEYETTKEDFTREPAWETYIFSRIYFKDEHLISIGFNSEVFMGGAHGYRGISFLNIDLQTGDLYSRKDLFTPEFRKFAETKFRENQGIGEEENINSSGFWFEDERFELPENIGFEEDRVVLVYNTYEIAPYTDGDYVLEIPLEEARPYLKLSSFAENNFDEANLLSFHLRYL